jgi:hypothetical protein
MLQHHTTAVLSTPQTPSALLTVSVRNANNKKSSTAAQHGNPHKARNAVCRTKRMLSAATCRSRQRSLHNLQHAGIPPSHNHWRMSITTQGSIQYQLLPSDTNISRADKSAIVARCVPQYHRQSLSPEGTRPTTLRSFRFASKFPMAS